MRMLCTCPFLLPRILARFHSDTLGSGHATGIYQLQSLEAGPGCKVGHRGLGQQIASWLLLHH